MASGGNVIIRFVTTYAGKGYDLLKAAMTSAGRLVMKSATTMAEAIGRVLSYGSKQISSFVSELGSLGKMIAQGGLWGAATYAVTKTFGAIGKRMEEAKEAAMEAARKVYDAFSRAAERIERQFKGIARDIADASARAKEMLVLRNARGDTRVAALLHDVNIETRKRLASARDDQERAVISADGKLAAAKIQAAEIQRKAVAASKAADEEVARAKERVAAASSSLAEQEENRAEAAGALFAVRNSKDEKKRQRAQDAVTKASEKEKAARSELASAEEALAKARHNAKVAVEEKYQANETAWEMVESAEFELAEATRKQKEAAEAKAEAERKAAEELQAVLKEQGRQFVEQYEASAKEARKKEAEERLAEEQEKAKEEQKKIGDSIERLLREIRDIEKARERTRKGMETDHKRHNGLFGPYQYHTDANGNISDFTDWNRANRYAGHDNDEQKARRRAETDDARMRNLWEDMQAGKYVSDSDQRKVERWRQFRKELDGEEQRKAQIEELKEKQQKAVIDSEKHLRQIKEDMKEFIENGCVK